MLRQGRQAENQLRAGHRTLVRTGLALSLFALIVTSDVPTLAQTTEYKVKAAYLYNFARYVTWPQNTAAETEFVIGVLGDNPFGDALDKIAVRKRVRGKSIRIDYFDTLADYSRCDILFVFGQVESEVVAAVIRQTRNQPVLLVSEQEDFCVQGGAMNFAPTASGTLGIEINIDALGGRQLQADAKLLKLANIVRDAS